MSFVVVVVVFLLVAVEVWQFSAACAWGFRSLPARQFQM